MTPPLILITNDDGFDSPGLAACVTALRHLGDLLIAAPATQQTSLGRAFPKTPDLGRIERRQVTIGDDTVHGYAIHGSPAYCVSHAILELAPREIALCVSGINYGENLGLSLMPSGTIGAAFEADTYNIPTIAASREVPATQHHSSDYHDQDWASSVSFLQRLATLILRRGYTTEVAVWNLNVPADATPATPWRTTRQSRQNYFVFRRPNRLNFDSPTKLPVEIEFDVSTLEKDSDIYCVMVDRCVSVTPLTWNMTATPTDINTFLPDGPAS